MKGYGQFCPVAKAAEILNERWTLLVVRELLCGSKRFNDLRRGVPLMSSSLLSQRLKSLEHAGLVERRHCDVRNTGEYYLTPAGEELRGIVFAFGEWGQRWVRSRAEELDLDAGLLMWDIRRTLDPGGFPPERTTIQFEYTDARRAKRYWWLVVQDGATELCLTDPGFPVDLYIRSDLRTMTRLWMGDVSLTDAQSDELIDMQGDRELIRDFEKWFTRSLFAPVARPVQGRMARPYGAGPVRAAAE